MTAGQRARPQPCPGCNVMPGAAGGMVHQSWCPFAPQTFGSPQQGWVNSRMGNTPSYGGMPYLSPGYGAAYRAPTPHRAEFRHGSKFHYAD